MASQGLRIETDEPGRRLVLTGPAPSYGRVIVGLVAPFLASLALAAFWHPAIWAAGLLLGAAFGLGVRRGNVVTGIVLDRARDQIEVRTPGAFGITAPVKTYRVSGLKGIRFVALTEPSSLGPRGLGLRITPMYGRRWANPARFRVVGVDSLAGAGELGRRIASAAGFDYERVVTSHSRELRLDFRAAADPGFQPMA